MMQITGFAESHIGNVSNRINNDFARYEVLETNIGTLHVGIVCDGADNAKGGARASSLAAETVLYMLKTTTTNEVPTMLVEAIETANQKIVETLNGGGVTTLAVAVIHIDSRTGDARLYIASVGDSPIFLYEAVDSGRLVRLNIDHNHATRDYMDGKISYYDFEARRQTPNGSILFNALGFKQEDLQVDLGIYFQRFKSEDDIERANERGLEGLPLYAGDTVIVASDGLTQINKNDEPYVSEHAIMQYAKGDNVERATQSLVEQAVANGTKDNVSLVMMFMPSPYRQKAPAATSLNLPWQRMAIVAVVMVILLGIGYLIATQVNASSDDHKQATELANANAATATIVSQIVATADALVLQETQLAINANATDSAATVIAIEEANQATETEIASSGQATLDTIATSEAVLTETLGAMAQESTAQAELDATAFAGQTATADYLNSIPTATSTPRPTLEIEPEKIGIVYMYETDTHSSTELFDEAEIDVLGETLILVDNGNTNPMKIYLAKDSTFVIDDFDAEKHSVDILLNAQANSFVETGYTDLRTDNTTALTLILAEDLNVRFSSQGACTGMLDLNSLDLNISTDNATQTQTIVFSCLGDADNCQFMDDQEIARRTSIIWDVEHEEIVETLPVNYEVANAYYEIYANYHAYNTENLQIPACLTLYIDIDGDGFRDMDEDECPTQSGKFDGCPASPTPRPVATYTPVPNTAVPQATNPPAPTNPPGPTNPPPPSNTPAPPQPTNTAIPPTNPPPPSNTPVPPQPTNTPVPPTNTPLPTHVFPPTPQSSGIPQSPVNTYPSKLILEQILNQWRGSLSL